MERGPLRPTSRQPVAAAGCTLAVRVQPKASRNACTISPDGSIRIAITAPPVDGEANEALVARVAGWLDLPKRAVRVISGATSREKVIAIEGLDAESAINRLRGAR